MVPTSTTAPFGVKFHFRPQPAFNHAACFVVNFTTVHARFNHRSFIAKRLLKTKPDPALPPSFYLVAVVPQILKFHPRCFAAKFRRNFTRRAAEFRSFIQSRRLLAQNPRDKIYAAFVRLRYKRAAFYRRRDDVF